MLKHVENRKLLLQAMCLLGLTVLIYSPALQGGFVFDDIGHLRDDRRIRTFAGLIKIWLYPQQDYQHQWYPLTSTTFWLMHRLWGFHTLGFHLVNVCFHACNALLLWRLLKQLNVPGSYWAAMIFAVHPVNVQSVAWIIELKNVQSCFFYLLSAVTFVHFILHRGKVNWGWYVLSILLFACALLSKAATSSLPLGLLLILIWKRREHIWRDLLLLIPFIVMGTFFAGYVKHLEENFSGEGVELGLHAMDRFALFGQTLWFYATQLVLPIDIQFIYPKWTVDGTQIMQWLPNIGLVLVVMLFVKLRKKWNVGPLVGLLYFFLAIGPLAFVSVAYMRFSYVANHWVYWASLSFLTLMATAVYQMFTSRKLQLAVMLIIVLVFGARSWFHASIYKNQTIVWRHVLQACPTLAIAHLNLANSIRGDDDDGSFRHYQTALVYNPHSFNTRFSLGTLYLQHDDAMLCRFYTTQALIYYPQNPFFRYQNARAKITLGQVKDGQAILEKTLKRFPDQFESVVLLAHTYLIENRVNEAAVLAQRAVKIDPDDKQTHGILGMVQARRGQFDQAKTNLLTAVMANPDFVDGLLTLAVINHQQGHLGAARMYYQRVLAIDPDSVAANEKLGLLFWEQGDWANALIHCSKAYALEPSRRLAHRRAADSLAQLGKLDEALAEFERLHEQSPSSPQILNELAWLYAIRGDERCLPLAQQVAKITHQQVAVVLDTLAASFATTGDFKQALHWTQQAMSLAKANDETQLLAGLQERLDRYAQNQRWEHYARSIQSNP